MQWKEWKLFFHDIQSKFLSRASLTSTPIRGAGIFGQFLRQNDPSRQRCLVGGAHLDHLRCSIWGKLTAPLSLSLSLASCHLFSHVYMMYCIQVQHWSMHTCNLICVELTVKWLCTETYSTRLSIRIHQNQESSRRLCTGYSFKQSQDGFHQRCRSSCHPWRDRWICWWDLSNAENPVSAHKKEVVEAQKEEKNRSPKANSEIIEV